MPGRVCPPTRWSLFGTDQNRAPSTMPVASSHSRNSRTGRMTGIAQNRAGLHFALLVGSSSGGQ
jgi:hypothetical protein